MRTAIARLVVLGLLVSACSGGAAEAEETTSTEQPPTTSSPSTTRPSTTSTTVDNRPTSLLNGLPVDDPALLERRVLAVKIDNHPRANPQSGIENADMMIELRVEGITRYISIWHESDSEYLGPMRSGRPTDPTLLAAMNEPTFAISGAQSWIGAIIASHDIHRVGESGPPATFRISGRNAPHDLYVSTPELRAVADRIGHPDEPPEGALWQFGPLPLSAEEASSVEIDFSDSVVTWDWDQRAGLWMRGAYGAESTYLDQEGEEQHIGVPVLVALYTDQYTARPQPGHSGQAVPASQTTGSGKAFVFAEGKAAEGTWERETETDWFTLKTTSGSTLRVPPGRVWVSLVPSSRGLDYDS